MIILHLILFFIYLQHKTIKYEADNSTGEVLRDEIGRVYQ